MFHGRVHYAQELLLFSIRHYFLKQYDFPFNDQYENQDGPWHVLLYGQEGPGICSL